MCLPWTPQVPARLFGWQGTEWVLYCWRPERSTMINTGFFKPCAKCWGQPCLNFGFFHLCRGPLIGSSHPGVTTARSMLLDHTGLHKLENSWWFIPVRKWMTTPLRIYHWIKLLLLIYNQGCTMLYPTS